jgi:hypothetical protein
MQNIRENLTFVENGTQSNEEWVLSESALIEGKVLRIWKPARFVGKGLSCRQLANSAIAVVNDPVGWDTGIDEALNNLPDAANDGDSNDQV